MALGLIDKLTSFLIPPDDQAAGSDRAAIPAVKDNSGQESERRPRLKVHSQSAGPLKIIIDLPTGFDDVQAYADHLRNSIAIIVNYQQVDLATQQRMSDFLNGVCYILDGCVQRISEQVVLYTYANIDIDKKIFAYSVPTYVRVKE
ncbi:cell division protein SepF [Sporomusa termitida]|uniref:Cell division protein SepF n=1 Tax=Sporomusa termitida TaxID=2377 RepID=A0A517DUL7_9FIRM|nr:cell division protein SepF [Sporomusa termitida]QDR81051.1 Cell division protein SepF [Sporomusa termitida]